MSIHLRALIVDDSADDTELLLRHLRRSGFEVEWKRVDTADGLRQALAQESWSIALCDYVMPHLAGLEALEILRSVAPKLPAITVSGNVGEEFAVNVMRAGARDYVRKDNLSRLAAAIERELQTATVERARGVAERRIQRVEECLELAVESAGIAFFDFEATTRMAVLSPQWAIMLGRPPGEFTRSLEEGLSLVHPDDREAVIAAGRADGKRYQVEFRMQHLDGSYRRLLMRGRSLPVPGAEDRIERVVGCAIDVTDRWRADRQRELRAAIASNMVEGVCLTRISDAQILYANPTFEKLFGYGPGELVGQSPSILNAGTAERDPQQTAAAIIDELRRTGEWRGEVYNRRKDGTPFWSFASVAKTLDAEHGEVWVVVQRDISEQKRLHAELEQSIAFLGTVLDNIPAMVFAKDLKTTAIVLYNRAAERESGRRREDVLGRAVDELWPPEQAAGFRREELTAQASGHPITAKEWVDMAHGDQRLLETTRIAIPDASGHPAFLVGIATDITERALSDAKLAEKVALLDLAHDAIIVRDTEDRVRFWNRGAEQTYGWSAAEAMGRVTHTLLQTKFPAPLETLEAALRDRGAWAGELVPCRRDGRTVVVASRWSLQRGTDGARGGTLEINRDITREKLADAERQRTDAILRSVFEQADVGIAVLESDSGRILQANSTYRFLSGLTADEIGNATWMSHTHPESVTAQGHEMRRLKDGEIDRCEFEPRYLRKDGSIARVQLNIRPLWRSGDAPTEQIVVARSIRPRAGGAPAAGAPVLH